MDHLQEMQWDLPVVVNLFEPEMTVLKASGPLDAIAMGLHETDRVMRTTYLTFIRLFQGSISPKNLNGPVGIVHTGTIIAERGLIWLLFFFAPTAAWRATGRPARTCRCPPAPRAPRSRSC